MSNYPLDKKLIVEEASWFDRSDEGVEYGEFTETWTTPKRYCYRCGTSITSFGSYVHPAVSLDGYGRYGGRDRQICQQCYGLFESHEKTCRCGASKR